MAREPQEQGRRGGRQAQSPNMLPVLGFVIVAVGAILVVGWVNSLKKKEKAQATKAAEREIVDNPFDDLPDEEPPSRAGGGSSKPSKSYVPSPSGLESDPVWLAAVEKGEAADRLFDEAKAARQADDRATWREKAAAAQEAYDEALTDSAAWTEEITEKHGERDRQVSRVRKVRKAWTGNLMFIRKTK